MDASAKLSELVSGIIYKKPPISLLAMQGQKGGNIVHHFRSILLLAITFSDSFPPHPNFQQYFDGPQMSCSDCFACRHSTA